MPETDLNVERSRRIRKDIEGKSASRERDIEVILIAIVCCDEIATGHSLVVRLSMLASNAEERTQFTDAAPAWPEIGSKSEPTMTTFNPAFGPSCAPFVDDRY